MVLKHSLLILEGPWAWRGYTITLLHAFCKALLTLKKDFNALNIKFTDDNNC